MTPENCLIACKKEGFRIAMTYQGNKCVCYEEIPYDMLVPISDDQCALPCPGDQQQSCGGQDSSRLLAYVQECEQGWVRFSHTCYKEGLSESDIFDNENHCAEMKANVWSPKSFDDLNFVELLYGSTNLHVGWTSYNKVKGVFSVDGSFEPLIMLVTHTSEGNPIINDCEDCFSKDNCVVFSSKEKKMILQSPCLPAKGICQKPLFRSYGYQPIGHLLNITIQDSPSLNKSYSLKPPFNVTILQDSLIPYLDVEANKPFLFSGLRIINNNYENVLKQFKVEFDLDSNSDVQEPLTSANVVRFKDNFDL